MSMSKNEIEISIVIPAFNEAARISRTLDSLKEYFSARAFLYEIIVVNDGSTDNTIGVVESHMKNLPHLHLINLPKNSGKGFAVKTGMLQSKGRHTLFMDADNSVTIDNLDRFMEKAKTGFDLVIGSIALRGAKTHEHNGRHRRLLSDWSKALIRKVVNLRIHDTQRGFKLFSRGAANRLFKQQTIPRYGFDIELLAIAQVFNYKIKELPVVWDNPAGSKVTMSSYFSTLKELAKIKMNLLMGKYR